MRNVTDVTRRKKMKERRSSLGTPNFFQQESSKVTLEPARAWFFPKEKECGWKRRAACRAGASKRYFERLLADAEIYKFFAKKAEL
jgi:hypothetical protein